MPQNGNVKLMFAVPSQGVERSIEQDASSRGSALNLRIMGKWKVGSSEINDDDHTTYVVSAIRETHANQHNGRCSISPRPPHVISSGKASCHVYTPSIALSVDAILLRP